MAGPGSRPGERRGGRQKGTPNKAVAARQLLLEASQRAALAGLPTDDRDKLSPLDVMLLAMHGALRADNVAEAAMHAVNAAPYLHPRLASTDTTIKSDNVHRLLAERPKSEAEWMAEHAATNPANDGSVVAQDASDLDAADG